VIVDLRSLLELILDVVASTRSTRRSDYTLAGPEQ
jgi:hypothetical protein